MIDTFEFGYLGPPVASAELRAFESCAPEGLKVTARRLPEQPEITELRWCGQVPGLGVVTLNRDGYLCVGGSLAKFRQRLFEDVPEECVSNEHMLTASEVNDTVQALTLAVERRFSWLPADALNVTRADVVYQRQVNSSMETLHALRGAMVPTRKGCAWFDNAQGVPTGLMLRGRNVAHRVYDKGLESGRTSTPSNLLRSEEQLRKRSQGFSRVWVPSSRQFDREACREVLNDRYIDVAFGQELDVGELVREGRHTMALLVLHPEWMSEYRQTVKKSGYYKMARQVREFRASAIPDDLRVPEDAWLQAA